jgi:pimeloyl-ACP methyl ester carboxylesterase
MSAVVIDGGIVHYEAFGRGWPILFLHGWLGSWRYWMSSMESVSDKYRTYALDLWGFGDSDKSDTRCNLPDYVALVDNFVENMGIGQAPIIGHSLGAIIALEYAVRHPDRVNKIMAVSLPVGEESINRNLVDFANDSMLAKMRWWRQITHPEVTKEVEKTNKEAINLSLQSVADIDMPSRIQSIGQWKDAMLLVVYGEKDDIIDPDPAQALDGQWDNIRPIGLSDSKHFPMLEEAAKFSRLLRDFLDVEGDLKSLELKDEWRRRTR